MTRTRTSRRSRDLERQLPMLAAALARSVHSGATLLGAVDEAADAFDDPAAMHLRAVRASVDQGVDLDGALERWRRSSGSPSVALLVAAARLGHAEGGDLGAALDGVAASLLDRVEVADEARALSSQAMTSAWVLVSLPVLGALCFSLLDPAVAATLFGTPAGWVCLLVGLCLDSLAAFVMARMVRTVTT